jgi:hypothetical protein
MARRRWGRHTKRSNGAEQRLRSGLNAQSYAEGTMNYLGKMSEVVPCIMRSRLQIAYARKSGECTDPITRRRCGVISFCG